MWALLTAALVVLDWVVAGLAGLAECVGWVRNAHGFPVVLFRHSTRSGHPGSRVEDSWGVHRLTRGRRSVEFGGRAAAMQIVWCSFPNMCLSMCQST